MTPLPCALAALDCETTGTDPATARIVEVAVVRVEADGSSSARAWRVNPGVPVGDSVAVHGITDAMVADAPPFADVAPEVAAALVGAVIVGHNARAYDVPLLAAEFARAGLTWPLADAQVIDTLALDRARTRHDLGAVVRRWCGREHVGAHGAEADAAASLDVLRAMLAAQPATVAELVAESNGNRATACGKVLWGDDGRAVWGFGKHYGKPLAHDRAYAVWVMRDAKDMPADVRALAARGARGEDVRRAPQGA